MSLKSTPKVALQFSMSLCSLLNFIPLDCGITLGYRGDLVAMLVVLFNETVKSERGARQEKRSLVLNTLSFSCLLNV